ncbi:hypothetical protein ACLOJK_009418 [Asimina triloba]
MWRSKGKKSRPGPRSNSSAPNAMSLPAGEDESQSQSQDSGFHDIQTEGEDSVMADPDPPARDSSPPSQAEEPHPMPASPVHDSPDPGHQPEEDSGMNPSRPPSPRPLTPPAAHDSESLSHHHQQEGEEEEDETQVVSSIPPLPAPPVAHDGNPPPVTHGAARKAGGKRKKHVNRKQQAAIQKKLRLLGQNLQPIPFRPAKTLDFSVHESLFRTLGLWDFAHIEFDRHIRSDLLAPLIANYNPSGRCSTVKDCRIMVNRADLARALKLPVKKDKASLATSDVAVSEQQGFSEEAISIVGEFLSNYILLHADMWMMPDEILVWERLLKEGQLQKIDWAGLIWFMVEKEISHSHESGVYYYASHLQHLMKVQKPELFVEEVEAVEEVSGEEEDDAVTAAVAMEEQGLDNRQVELSLGNDRNGGEPAGEDNMMDFPESKEENGQWFLDGRINGNEQCMRQCNLNDIRSSDCGPAGGADEDDGYGPSSRFTNLSRFASADLLPDMETANGSYIMHSELLDASSGELLRADMHRNTLPLNSSSLSMFGADCKQENDDDDDDDDVHHLSQDEHQRKIRNDGSWGSHSTMSFGMCIGQAQSGLEKAAMMYEEKVQECNQARMNIQYLSTQLQHRTNVITSLQKDIGAIQSKKDMEIFQLVHEINIMSQLLEGYKMALRNTRRAFAEYRERYQVPCEPIYKDVDGSGGLVLSSSEVEKRRLEKEEERRMRSEIDEKLHGIEQDLLSKFDLYLEEVDSMNKRVLCAAEEIKLLKENGKREIPASE